MTILHGYSISRRLFSLFVIFKCFALFGSAVVSDPSEIPIGFEILHCEDTFKRSVQRHNVIHIFSGMVLPRNHHGSLEIYNKPHFKVKCLSLNTARACLVLLLIFKIRNLNHFRKSFKGRTKLSNSLTFFVVVVFPGYSPVI